MASLVRGHEVMVCQCGPKWQLILKRSDTGPFPLPELCDTLDQAVEAAQGFIDARKADIRYTAECWYYLVQD